MASGFDAIDGERGRSRRWPVALILLLIAFAGGAAAMGFALTHWSAASRFLAARADPVPAVPTPQAVPAALPPRAAAAATLPEAEGRIASMEARMDQIDTRASAAMADADRAEGLLVAIAARRAIDSGVTLGYLESLLRDRFGPTQPQAVATIIAAGRQPTTLDELRGGLNDVAPMLASQSPNESWWDGFGRELAGLIVVRKANTPSPAPADRLARAKTQLEAGHVGAALAEVARMPGRDRAERWIGQARRYAAAHEALDVIETTALLDQRGRTPVAAPPTPAAISAGR